jgi:hypothetical protein
MIRPQIIEREGKPEYAVIPIAEWRRIQTLLEELEDIRDFDAALANRERRMIPFEVTSAILDGASPIRAWREHRGLSRSDLLRATASPRLNWRRSRTARKEQRLLLCAGWPGRCARTPTIWPISPFP